MIENKDMRDLLYNKTNRKKFVSVCACCIRDEGNRVTSLEHFYHKKWRKREGEGETHAF